MNPCTTNVYISHGEQHMVTLKEVAQKAGVSPSTASAAIRGMDIVRPDTAKRVLDTAAKLNYQINMSARALRSGRTNIYTMLIPDLENQFYAKLANALSNELAAHGKRLIVQTNNFKKDKELEQLAQISASMCDGVFIASTHNTGREIHEALKTFPALLFDDMSPDEDAYYDSIETPSQAGMHALIRHLVSLGRKRIGIVGTFADNVKPVGKGSPTEIAFAIRQNRYDFAAQAMQAYGLPVDDAFIVSDWSVNAGIETAHQLVKQGLRFDALCCANDDLALGIIRGLLECGVRVPEDVAVTGFDGIAPGSFTTPTLTTISSDYQGMAQTAIDMMESQVEQPEEHTMPRRIIVGFQLLQRESTLGFGAGKD